MQIQDTTLECLTESYNITLLETELIVYLKHYYTKKEMETASIEDVDALIKQINVILDCCERVEQRIDEIQLHYFQLKEELEQDKDVVYNDELVED